MDTKQIVKELEKVLKRYRAGLLPLEKARQEQSLLKDMLRAYELSELQEKVERLEGVLEARAW